MRIIIDVREHSLIEKINSTIFNQNYKTKMDISQAALDLGDISIQDDSTKEILIIERKSLTDLLSSIKDGRYDEQSHRLIHSSGLSTHKIYYVIEGLLSQITAAEKRIVFSAMTSLNYFKGFSVFRTSSVNETAELVLAMVDKIGREMAKNPAINYFPSSSSQSSSSQSSSSQSNSLPSSSSQSNSSQSSSLPSNSLPLITDAIKDDSETIELPVPVTGYNNFVKKVKRDNITPQNIGEIMLSQIPGVSPNVAQTILAKFRSFPHFVAEIQTNPECLKDMTVVSSGKTRKISKTVLKSIVEYISEKPN